MKLLVKGKNVEVSQRLRNYAEKRLSKLSAQLDDEVTRLELEITEEKNPRVSESHVAEVTLITKRRALRAKEASHDIYASIDLVADKLARQVKKYHDKRIQDRRGGPHGHEAKDRWKGALSENGTGNAALPPEYQFVTQTMEDTMGSKDGTLRIVKTKQFRLGPMSPEEAAEQMSLVGHDFFMFVNDETEETCVIYKRADGAFGLIESTEAAAAEAS